MQVSPVVFSRALELAGFSAFVSHEGVKVFRLILIEPSFENPASIPYSVQINDLWKHCLAGSAVRTRTKRTMSSAQLSSRPTKTAVSLTESLFEFQNWFGLLVLLLKVSRGIAILTLQSLQNMPCIFICPANSRLRCESRSWWAVRPTA